MCQKEEKLVQANIIKHIPKNKEFELTINVPDEEDIEESYCQKDANELVDALMELNLKTLIMGVSKFSSQN